ncbi:MAG TPA: serine hydrolase [Actinomycetes bacterium]
MDAHDLLVQLLVVGIPADRLLEQLTSLDQTVGELLARHLPKGADPRLARVAVEQLLTMTSGLAGDDPSLGGDRSVMDGLIGSRDWVRHILGGRLATTPGTRFAYSSARMPTT